VREGEIRLYYCGSDDTHTGWRKGAFALARLRPDGFAGYEPVDGSQAAVVVTRPIRCEGRPLRVSADAAGGSLQVTVLDARGAELGVSRPIRANVTDAAVEWDQPGFAAWLKGRSVSLRFEFRSAKIYALRF
jgi:hypothetical protein